MSQLLKGLKVEGRLWLEETANGDVVISFKQYNRKPRNLRNNVILRLEHGWVKESAERIKLFESLPKDLGLGRMLSALSRETDEVKRELVRRELDLYY